MVWFMPIYSQITHLVLDVYGMLSAHMVKSHTWSWMGFGMLYPYIVKSHTLSWMCMGCFMPIYRQIIHLVLDGYGILYGVIVYVSMVAYVTEVN